MKTTTKKKGRKQEFIFEKENYRLFAIGAVMIFVGFLLMAGGGSDDPNVFSEEIFSFRRITLAPLMVLAGYGLEIYAIMKKPKNKKQESQN